VSHHPVALLLALTVLAGEPPVAVPDLAALEPAVAEQIAAAAERLRAVLTPPADATKRAAAYGELGELFHAYHLAEPAAACYRNAERLEPRAFRWPHLAGLLLQEAGRLADAEAAYGRALAREPRDLPALVHQGEILLLTGRTAEAETALHRALAAEPHLPAAQALLGQAALADGRYAEAARLFGAALAAVPAADRLHYPLGLAYRGLGDAARATEHMNRAGRVGVRPADPLDEEVLGLRTGERLHLARGKAAAQAGQLAEAAKEFRQALAARPESTAARINLASVLAAMGGIGDRAGAVALLREAIAAEPGNATARFNLGLLLAADGAAREAREQLAAAVAARPDDAEAHRALAQVLRDLGGKDDLAAALAEYGRAVTLAPADETARLGEAETLVRLGRYGQARARLEDGRQALPASGQLAAGLARLLAACPDPSLRDGARAFELAQLVFAAQPSAAHAALVAMALAELGRCPEAAEWQRKAIAHAADTASAGLPAARVAELNATLATYERGAPCRPPVPPG
jgi:tetratricopeptide (TPR) repeat protein